MKTKNKVHDALAYSFSPGEQLLIDTNIWLFLQPPPSSSAPWWAKKYSGIYARALKAKATVLTDCMILSEYINRYIRIEYNAVWASIYPRYKDFRNSADFSDVAKDAIAGIKGLLSTCSLTGTDLPSLAFTDILDVTETGIMDFNDAVLIENCRVNGWKLLTDDSDMELGGIDVLTANRKLLIKCP